jgi:hypothetical protein
MKLGDTIHRSYRLYRDRLNGKPVYKVEENTDRETDGARILVRMDQETGQWVIVENLDREISHQDLKKWFGLWKEQEVTKGFLFWKKTCRPTNSDIERESVTPFREAFREVKLEGNEILAIDNRGCPRKQHFYYSTVVDSGIRFRSAGQDTHVTLEQTSLICRRGTINRG